jgi:exosortase B
MSKPLVHQSIASLAFLSDWWLILFGFLALYIPTYYALLTGLWRTEDQAHGPVVLIVVLYLVWKNRDKLRSNLTTHSSTVLGSLAFGFGLLCYTLGRSQDILLLDIGSQIPLFAGVLLLTRGMPALKAMWFPLFFVIFMIPLPGFFLDTVTMPMKIAVSYMAENVLFWFGYPIARTGVVLQIGQYQLLVADACSGIHTLISLEALGLLYLNVVKHYSLFRNVILAVFIVPISFVANVIRVMLLTLVIYYYGDAAGQGFVHSFSSIVLFVVALSLIMGMDSVLQYLVKIRSGVR